MPPSRRNRRRWSDPMDHDANVMRRARTMLTAELEAALDELADALAARDAASARVRRAGERTKQARGGDLARDPDRSTLEISVRDEIRADRDAARARRRYRRALKAARRLYAALCDGTA